MQNSKRIAAILFVLGLTILCGFLTPFIHNDSGELVHTRITFVGKLLIGRFLMYIVLLMAVCLGIIMAGRVKHENENSRIGK